MPEPPQMAPWPEMRGGLELFSSLPHMKTRIGVLEHDSAISTEIVCG